MNWTANPAGLCSRLEVQQHVIFMLISFLIFWYSFNSKFNTFIINFLLYSSLFFIHLIQNLMNTSFNLSIIFKIFFIIDSTKNHLNFFIVYFYLIMLIGTWVACENHKFITKINRTTARRNRNYRTNMNMIRFKERRFNPRENLWCFRSRSLTDSSRILRGFSIFSWGNDKILKKACSHEISRSWQGSEQDLIKILNGLSLDLKSRI